MRWLAPDTRQFLASAGALSTLLGSQSQPSRAKSSEQFATADLDRAMGDDVGAELFWDVIVIALKSSAWDASSVGEFVKLVEVTIADQVTPAASPPVPQRFVDQDCHGQPT